MSQDGREMGKNLFLMDGSKSNATARSLDGKQAYERHSMEEELMAEADTEEIAGERYSTVVDDGQGATKGDDPDGKSLLDDHQLDQFAELDQEVERYVTRALSSMESPPITSRPLLQRIFANLRSRLFSNDGDGQRPIKSSKEHLKPSEATQSIETAIPQVDPDVVTCRICDMPIDATTLDGHTEWCSKYQDGLLKKEKCAKYLYLLLESLSPEEIQLRLLVAKALEIDEETGRPASVRLAKLLYKIAKISSLPRIDERNDEQMIKRLRYLVDQKRILAERFIELKPAILTAPMTSEASSGTDSSIDSTPSMQALSV